MRFTGFLISPWAPKLWLVLSVLWIIAISWQHAGDKYFGWIDMAFTVLFFPAVFYFWLRKARKIALDPDDDREDIVFLSGLALTGLAFALLLPS